MNPTNFELTMLSIGGPIWLPSKTPATEIFPAKPACAPVIALMAGTVEVSAPDKTVLAQPTDDAGRMSRAIPLHLAERIEFSTTATTRSLFPYVVKPSPAFALMGKRTEDKTAAGYARPQKGRAADCVITTHLLKNITPWIVELRLIRANDARCVMETSAPFAPAASTSASAAACMEKFETALRDYFARETNIAAATPPAAYQPPPAAALPAYLACAERLLAIRAAATFKAQYALHAERDILLGQLELCARLPRSAPARFLLLQSLASLNELRPGIVGEFRERVNTLQKENPLPPAQQIVVGRLLSSLFP